MNKRTNARNWLTLYQTNKLTKGTNTIKTGRRTKWQDGRHGNAKQQKQQRKEANQPTRKKNQIMHQRIEDNEKANQCTVSAQEFRNDPQFPQMGRQQEKTKHKKKQKEGTDILTNFFVQKSFSTGVATKNQTKIQQKREEQKNNVRKSRGTSFQT